MERSHGITPFHKILVPVVAGCDPAPTIAAARSVVGDGQILLMGLVRIGPEGSLSGGAAEARAMRRKIRELADSRMIRVLPRVRVTQTPWEELLSVIRREHPDLLILDWPRHFETLHLGALEALTQPPCNTALVRGPIPESPRFVLNPIRGGPYAELALRLSLGLAQTRKVHITSLHLRPVGKTSDGEEADRRDAAYKGFRRVLAGLPEVTRIEADADNTAAAAAAIVERSRAYDLVVMGANVFPADESAALGGVAAEVLSRSPAGVIVVKGLGIEPEVLKSEAAGQGAISVLVDKWFAENTFDADEFADLDQLLLLKQEQQVTISLALPTLNEEKTVGNVIQMVKRALMDQVPLLDEIILMDSDSTDRTRDIARDLGIPVFIHQQTLPRQGARRGKGEALWKSLFVTCGDIIAWIDTDIVNIHPRFVYGLLGPLLLNPRFQLVKGYYRRPLKVGDKIQEGGGRVTELTARPLLNLFYPELSGVIQPLAGEYAARRVALERVPFFSGYGVETGLLIDVFEAFGLGAIAQVDLLERLHHNQPIEALSKMSFAIIQAVIRKLERRYGRQVLDDVNKTMKLIRYEARHYHLEVEEIIERERPPMVNLPEYCGRPEAKR